MSEERAPGKPYVRYVVAAAVGVAIALGTAGFRGGFAAESVREGLKYFSDGFFVAAVVLTGVGLLTAISADGMFDIIGYGFTCFISVFRRDMREKRYAGLFEYRQSKKGRGPQWHLAIVGGLFLVAALALTLVYGVA